MEYSHYIQFKKETIKPIKITEFHYQTLKKIINKEKFVEVNGEVYSTSSIEGLVKIKKEPLMLAPPEPKPISKDLLDKFKQDIKKRFSWA